MRRLLIWITMLTALFSGIIALTGHLGKTAPPPELVKWFTYPDGTPCKTPCLFGILPNITKLAEIEDILRSHPSIYNVRIEPVDDDISIPSARRFYIYDHHALSADVWISSIGDSVFSIFVSISNSHNKEIKFVDFMQVLGFPKKASLALYNGYREDLFLFGQRVRMETPPIAPLDLRCNIKFTSSIWKYQINSDKSFLERPEWRNWAGFAREDYWYQYYALEGATKVPCIP